MGWVVAACHRAIQKALAEINGVNFSVGARNLMGVWRYGSERTLSPQSGEPVEFLERFSSCKPLRTQSEPTLLAAAGGLRLLFPFTEEEVGGGGGQSVWRVVGVWRGALRRAGSAAVSSSSRWNGHGAPRLLASPWIRSVRRRTQSTLWSCFGLAAVVLFCNADGLLALVPSVLIAPTSAIPTAMS